MIPALAFSLLARDPYLLLAEGLPAKQWETLRARIETNVPGDVAPLEIQRSAARRWASIMEGVHRLTDAPYSRERPVTGEEFEKVVRLSGLACWTARVRFADGDRAGAVTALLDGTTLEWRVLSHGFLTPCSTLDVFADSLDQIPLSECERVRKAADALLALAPKATPEGTRLRLLRLHLRIEAYRWLNLRLPVATTDAAPVEETTDPTTGKPYGYETTPAGPLVFGDASDGSGRITLRGYEIRKKD